MKVKDLRAALEDVDDDKIVFMSHFCDSRAKLHEVKLEDCDIYDDDIKDIVEIPAVMLYPEC